MQPAKDNQCQHRKQACTLRDPTSRVARPGLFLKPAIGALPVAGVSGTHMVVPTERSAERARQVVEHVQGEPLQAVVDQPMPLLPHGEAAVWPPGDRVTLGADTPWTISGVWKPVSVIQELEHALDMTV